MKKYLMMGALALTATTAFVSCSKEKDLYDPSMNAQKFIQDYQQAFIRVFGQPAANQAWGFDANASRATRATRADFTYYSFPGDADASKFLEDVPAGVEKLTQNDSKVNGYIDATWTGDLNVWGGWDGSKNTAGTLYIKGNCDFSNRKFYFAGNSELYLVKGATLTLNAENAGNLQEKTNIYLAEGAKIVTTGELKLNNGLHIFNHGTIEAGKLSTNSNSWLINGGTVTVTGKISVENDLSVLVNNGTITAADLNTAGSGKLLNNKNITITGTTLVNSNNNTWVNAGHYHTGNFIYNAASDEVINNCNLTVDEDFNINLGDNPGNGNFKMGDGSGVVTKYFNGGGNWAKNYSTGLSEFNGGPFYILMGEASVFKVSETATMNATKANYGIYGPTSGHHAVFQAKNIVAGKANQGYEVTYGGNLYVSAETHFAQGYTGQYPYIDFKDGCTIENIYAAGFTSGKPAYSIAKDECNPGFVGSGVEPVAEIIRVFGEDLSATEASDFDFNDVVFDAKKVDDTHIEITLWAAGGTLPLRIYGNNEAEAFEVHAVLGTGTKCMTNTHAKEVAEWSAQYGNSWKDNCIDGEPYVKRITVDNMNTADYAENFPLAVRNLVKVEVQKGEEGDAHWYELTAEKGVPTCKIACKVIDTRWMKERKQLVGSYPDFESYVGTGYPTNWWSTVQNEDNLYGTSGLSVICDICGEE